MQGAEPSASSSTSPGAVRTADKHQRSSLLRAAHLRRIRAKAEDESRKVDEVSFINNLTNAGKKADLQQRLEDGEWEKERRPSTGSCSMRRKQLSRCYHHANYSMLAGSVRGSRHVHPVLLSKMCAEACCCLLCCACVQGRHAVLKRWRPSWQGSRRQPPMCARQLRGGGWRRQSGWRSLSTGRGARRKCRCVVWTCVIACMFASVCMRCVCCTQSAAPLTHCLPT